MWGIHSAGAMSSKSKHRAFILPEHGASERTAWRTTEGKIVRVPQLSLKSSRLMGRRNSQQTVDLLELKSGEEPSH